MNTWEHTVCPLMLHSRGGSRDKPALRVCIWLAKTLRYVNQSGPRASACWCRSPAPVSWRQCSLEPGAAAAAVSTPDTALLPPSALIKVARLTGRPRAAHFSRWWWDCAREGWSSLWPLQSLWDRWFFSLSLMAPPRTRRRKAPK